MKTTSIFRTAMAVALASYPFSSTQSSVSTIVETVWTYSTRTYISTYGIGGGSETSVTVTSIETSVITDTATRTLPVSTANRATPPQSHAPLVPGLSASQAAGPTATTTDSPGVPPLSTAPSRPATPGIPAVIPVVGIPAPLASNIPANGNNPTAEPIPPAAAPSSPPPGIASYPPSQSSSSGTGNVVPVQGPVPNSPSQPENSLPPSAPQPSQMVPSAQQPPPIQPTNAAQPQPQPQPSNDRDNQNGSNSSARNGADGSSGRAGKSGSNGSDGRQGSDGSVGDNGKNGKSGSNGSNNGKSGDRKKSYHKSCSIFCSLFGLGHHLASGGAAAIRGGLNTAGQIVDETGKVIEDGTLFFDQTTAQVYDSANNLIQGGIDSSGNVIDTSHNIIPGGMISVRGVGIFPPPFHTMTGVTGKVITSGGQTISGSINTAGEIVDATGKVVSQGRFMVTEGGTVTNAAGQPIQGGVDTAGNVIDTAGSVVQGGKVVGPGGLAYTPRLPLPTPVVDPAPVPPGPAAPIPPAGNAPVPPAPAVPTAPAGNPLTPPPPPATPQASPPTPSSPISTPSRSASTTTLETSTQTSSSSMPSTSEASSDSTSSDPVSVTTVTETTTTATTTQIDGTLHVGGTFTHSFTATPTCNPRSPACAEGTNNPVQGFDFAGHLGWIASKLENSPLFFAKLTPPESLVKCDKPMTPLEFVDEVKKSGMRIDELVKHLPDEPSRGTPDNEKWASYLKPLRLCDESYDMRLPLKPDPSWNYASNTHYNAVLFNYVNFFTDEAIHKIDGIFPLPNSPPCPPWAFRQLAKTATKLKEARDSTRKDTSEFPYMASLEHRRMCLPQINGVLDLPRRNQYLSEKAFQDDLKQWDMFVESLLQGRESAPPTFHPDSGKEEPPQEQVPPDDLDAERQFHDDFQHAPDFENFARDSYVGLHALEASWKSQIDAPAPKIFDLLKYAQNPELQRTMTDSGIRTSNDWFHHDQLAAVIDEWAQQTQGFHVQLGLWTTTFVNGKPSNKYYLSDYISKLSSGSAIRLWIGLATKMSKTPEYCGLLRSIRDTRPKALPPAGTRPLRPSDQAPLTPERAWEEDFWGEKQVFSIGPYRNDLSGLRALVESWAYQMVTKGPTVDELKALLKDREVLKIFKNHNIPRSTPYVDSHQLAVIVDIWALRKHELHIILGILVPTPTKEEKVLEDLMSEHNSDDIYKASRIWIFGQSANNRLDFGGLMKDSLKHIEVSQDQLGGQDQLPQQPSQPAIGSPEEAHALFKKDFRGRTPSLIRAAGDGLCGLHAIINS